jgi:hypothetical protein
MRYGIEKYFFLSNSYGLQEFRIFYENTQTNGKINEIDFNSFTLQFHYQLFARREERTSGRVIQT